MAIGNVVRTSSSSTVGYVVERSNFTRLLELPEEALSDVN